MEVNLWNRKSCWSTAVLARLTEAQNLAVNTAVELFSRAVAAEQFTNDDQREEAFQLLITGVADAVANIEIRMRPHQQQIEAACK